MPATQRYEKNIKSKVKKPITFSGMSITDEHTHISSKSWRSHPFLGSHLAIISSTQKSGIFATEAFLLSNWLSKETANFAMQAPSES
jgi:hypothetical protein